MRRKDIVDQQGGGMGWVIGLGCVLGVWSAGCGGGSQQPGPAPEPEPAPASLELQFRRAARATPMDFGVELLVRDAQGVPLDGSAPTLSVTGGRAGLAQPIGLGLWHVPVEADGLDQGVTVAASLPGTEVSITREALLLAWIAPAWGLPELVPGLVNTPGWEDSVEISPDGQWLIVGSYSPVDLLSCLVDGNDPDSDACNRAWGPIAAPERPDFFGAERVLDAQTIRHQAPSLCLMGQDGGNFELAIPPVAAYGFRRQSDGSFAQPFAIGFDMDGYTVAPFGFSFLGAPRAGFAEVVFANANLLEVERFGLTPDLYTAVLELGSLNVLGVFECGALGIDLIGDVAEGLEVMPRSAHKGNPYYDVPRERIWFDDEGTSPARIYSAARVAGPGSAWSAPQAVAAPVNLPGQSSFQPFLWEDRLYWALDFQSIESAPFAADPPEDPAAWGAARTELALAPPLVPPDLAEPGQVVSIGEPSLARDGSGTTWLYFVVGRRTRSGFDADVARVPIR